MRRKQYDAVIIGAGPVGTYCARLLEKAGLKCVLIEEHKDLGRPVHCAGLVGKKVFEDARLKLPSDCIINTIDGALVHLENDTIRMQRKEVAYVIDRERFDKRLGENLDIRFETRCIGLEQNATGYVVETDKGDIKAPLVIGADGARSSVREYVNPGKIMYLKGVQFRMKLPAEARMVEVFLERPYFYWIIPESDKVARVGVLSHNPYHDLVTFLKKRALSGKILEKFAGMVPLTHFHPLSKGRVFLVGDSASQIKPLTYGGLYMGMRGAELLADCVVKGAYGKYSAHWHKRFGKEVTVALRAREIFQRLTDTQLRRIFAFAKERAPLIEQKADFENHSTLAWEFMRDPRASAGVVHILLNIIKAGFGKQVK